MIALITKIPIANDIPRIVKWEVVDVHDYVQPVPPYLIASVALYGPGSVAFGIYNLLIYDGLASTVLTVNPTPQQVSDQFLYNGVILDGTPYTTLSALWNGATTPSTRKGRLKALENALVTVGALSPEFAGS